MDSMSNENQIYTFDQYLEHQKLIAKFEDALEKKEYELSSIMKIYQDLKDIHERTRKECADLNSKLINSYNEKSITEKKFENELSTQKANYDKQKEVYEQQWLKLASYDPESWKNKIQSETEIKFKQIWLRKEMEIEELQNNWSDIKRQYELWITEYESFKTDAIKEWNTQREVHQSEWNDWMQKIQLQNDKTSNNIDRESFRELKNELDASRRQVNDLTTELENWRRDKEQWTIERNELKMNTMKEWDKEKFNNKMISTENERNCTWMTQMKNEVDNARSKINEKTQEIKEWMNEKVDLIRQVHEKDNEFQAFKSEIITLRNRLEVYEKEMNENWTKHHHEQKEHFFKEKSDKESYQKQIEDWTTELKDVKINFKNYHERATLELHNAQRDYQISWEEKKILMKRQGEWQHDLEVIRNDYDSKTQAADNYEREYHNIETRYREMSRKWAEATSHGAGKDYNDIIKKYKELTKKKEYYKSQCKIANENISKIIKVWKPEQKKEIETNFGASTSNYNPMLSQTQSEADGF